MAKKIGEHGDNLNRGALLWHLRHVPAIAAEFGDADFVERENTRSFTMASTYIDTVGENSFASTTEFLIDVKQRGLQIAPEISARRARSRTLTLMPATA
jgi:hypothetical protein